MSNKDCPYCKGKDCIKKCKENKKKTKKSKKDKK